MKGKIFDYCLGRLSEKETEEVINYIYSTQKGLNEYIEIKNFIAQRRILKNNISKKELSQIHAQLYEIIGEIPRKSSFNFHSIIIRSMSVATVVFIVVLAGLFINHRNIIKKEEAAKAYLSSLEVVANEGDIELELPDGEVIMLGGDDNSTRLDRKDMKIIARGNILSVQNTANASSKEKEQEVKMSYVTVKSKDDFYMTLQDGTKVWLREGSKIGFPEKFANERVVELEGEAYFDVYKNPDAPFIIKVNDASIKVLGTEFNIKCIKGGTNLQLSMASGVVSFDSPNLSKPITLVKNEEILFSQSDGQYSIKEIDSYKYSAWKDGYFVFMKEPLEEVMYELANWYDIDIDVDKRYKAILFNGKIDRKDSFDKVLLMLQETIDFNYLMEGTKLYLY